MNKNIITLTILFIFLFSKNKTWASFPDSARAKLLLSKIKLIKAGAVKGYIIDIAGSTVFFVPKREWNNGFYSHTDTIPVEKISVILNRKKGAVSKLAGAGGGLLIGGLIGYGIGNNNRDHYDDETFLQSIASKEALPGAAVLGTVGVVYGFISEGKKKKKRFKIKGSRLMMKYKRFDILSA